jgi:fructokinase
VIVVAGEALVDLVVRPDGGIAAIPGGGPYNAARAIARLEVEVAWLGALSSDRFGRELEAGLRADGVSTALVQGTDAPTTLALAELDATGAASYRFYTEGTSAPALETGRGIVLPAETRAVHVGTLGLVLEPMATTLEALVGALPDDVLVLVDPNCRPTIVADETAYRARLRRVLGRADVVKVSADDLAYLCPGLSVDAAAAWVGSLGARAVLVTDGGRDVRALVAGVTHTLAVPQVRVVDSVGAGDAFGGAVLAALVQVGTTRATLDTPSVLRAARMGIHAASLACTRPGADPPTLQDLGGWPAA